MPSNLACQKCKKHFFPPAFTPDWTAFCPWCAFPNRVVNFKVPGKFQTQCPGCKKILQSPLTAYKKQLQCPFCNVVFKTDTGQEPPAELANGGEKEKPVIQSFQQPSPLKTIETIKAKVEPKPPPKLPVEAFKVKVESKPLQPTMPVEAYKVKEESPPPIPPIARPLKEINQKKEYSVEAQTEETSLFEKLKSFAGGIAVIIGIIFGVIKGINEPEKKPQNPTTTSFRQTHQINPNPDLGKSIFDGIDKDNKEYFDPNKFQDKVNNPVFTPQQAKRNYREIDEHALAAPKGVEAHVKDLAIYLMQKATDDHMKARAAFRWIVDRIEYDDEGLKKMEADTNFHLDTTPKNCIYVGRTICAGYAKLFCVLCDAMGVESRYVTGFGRSDKEKSIPAQMKDEVGHAWNAVKLDGVWHLLDCTWGDGKIIDKKDKTKEFYLNEFYFLATPDQFIFNHFPDPEKNQFQLLSSPYSWEEFRGWPYVDNDLFTIGFTVKAVREKIRQENFNPVEVGLNPIGLKVVEAPLNKNLRAGLTQRFAFTCSPEFELFTSYKGPHPWDPFKWNSGGQHWYTIVEPRKGEFEIIYRRRGAKQSETGLVFMTYSVN